jgi:hypothetical protein
MSICELRWRAGVETLCRAKPEPEGLLRLEQQLAERMVAVDIIDALSDTEHWLNWSRYFGPIRDSTSLSGGAKFGSNSFKISFRVRLAGQRDHDNRGRRS